MFSYRVVDPSGRRFRSREAAADSATLRQALEARGLLVLDMAAAEPVAIGSTGGFRFARQRQLLEATGALAALLAAGLPLARALGAAAGVASGAVAASLQAVRERVERGESLATALSHHQGLFPPLYTGLVRAGERSGDLAGAFSRLTAQLEREEALRSRLISASIYPLLLATAGGIAVVVLLFFVLPRFVELLQGAGATLPRSTALLLGISAGLRHHVVLIAILCIGLVGLATWLRTSEVGHRTGAAWLLRMPLIGGLRRHALAARFARLMSVLLGGGAPLLVALDETIDCIEDPIGRDDALRIRSRVREGIKLHQAIDEGGLYPRVLTQLLAVGDESGRLEEFLCKAADLLEERTERFLQRLVALAEPAMIVCFGAVVGFVALALLQAIYGVNAGSFR